MVVFLFINAEIPLINIYIGKCEVNSEILLLKYRLEMRFKLYEYVKYNAG